jgi:nucleotide-binding universal stress UspA family protein
LNKSKEKLVKSGWAESSLQVRAREKRSGLARDILFEAERGAYDAVVVGRRGLSKLEEFFLGSVSSQVIQGAKDIPVWVVGGKITTPRILVSVDGSENSLRAVDHLSFVLGSCTNEDIRVLLFNAWPGMITVAGPRIFPNLSALGTTHEKYEKNLTPFFDRCEAMLVEGGLPPSGIKRKICFKCPDIGQAILSEADKGGYETIVLGRRGISRAKEFFIGSVSNKVLQQAGSKTVWLVG